MTGWLLLFGAAVAALSGWLFVGMVALFVASWRERRR